MAKKNLKFDFRKLNGFCEIWHEVVGGGASPRPVEELLFSARCYKKTVTRTNQSQLHAGSFDLYQVNEFIIRKNPQYNIEKDMFILSGGDRYSIRAVEPLDNRPEYIKITTETK